MIKKLNGNDTSIFYVDDHTDGYDEGYIINGDMNERVRHSRVYPDLVDMLGAPRVLQFCGLPEDGKDFQIYRSAQSGNHYRIGPNPIFTSYPISFGELIKFAREKKTTQFHIDPDAFSPEQLLRLGGIDSFDETKLTKEQIRKLVYSFPKENRGEPERYMQMIREINPDFLGLFEIYPHRVEGEAQKELVSRIIRNLAELQSNIKYVVVDDAVTRGLPHMKDELASFGEVIEVPAYTERDERNPKYDPDLPRIMNKGQTFGVFMTHSSGVFTYDVDFLIQAAELILT